MFVRTSVFFPRLSDNLAPKELETSFPAFPHRCYYCDIQTVYRTHASRGLALQWTHI
jgi:hypothetical protein